jgi:hypothetical protein
MFRQYRRPPAVHLALVLLAASGVTAANEQEQPESWPDWLKEAMAREAGVLESTPIALADGQYRFRLAGKAGEPGAFDGGWYVESDIGGDGPLECYLLTDSTDLATLIVNIADINIEAQAEGYGGAVGNRSVAALDAGAIDGVPYLALEWMYTIGEAPEALLGLTKVRAASNGDVVQACAHNVVGYRDTFRRVFEKFVRSAQVPGSNAEPYYEEVAVQSVGGQRVGVAIATYTLDEAGDSRVDMSMSSLIPVGPGSLSYEDSSTINWSSPDGLLINAYTANTQNGDLVTNLELARNEKGDWLVAGTFQGKEIEVVIDGAAEPLSELGQMQVTRKLFAGKAAEAAFAVWLADADPTRILEGRLVRDESSDALSGELMLGPMAFDARFDASGALTRAEMQMGATVISIDRIWHRGAPK